MNKKVVIGTVLIASSAAPVVVSFLKFRKNEIAKRQEIANNLLVDLDAIKRAALRMQERMKDPEYRPGVTKVLDDLNFEIIAAHYE